jgi:hypothetical protein
MQFQLLEVTSGLCVMSQWNHHPPSRHIIIITTTLLAAIPWVKLIFLHKKYSKIVIIFSINTLLQTSKLMQQMVKFLLRNDRLEIKVVYQNKHFQVINLNFR